MKVKPASIDSFLRKIPKEIKVVLLYGADSGLADEYRGVIVKNFLGEGYKDLQVVQFFSDSLKEDSSKLLEEAYSVSLFDSNNKVIIIREAKDWLTKIIKEYLTNQVEECLIIIQGEELATSSSLRKLCEVEDSVATIACYLDNVNTLKQAILGYLKQDNFEIHQEALGYLTNNLGNDRGITKKEIEKIMLYKHYEKYISLEDAENVIGNNASIYLDKLIFSFFNLEIERAYKYLIVLLEDHNVVSIVRTLSNHLQKVLQVKILVDQGRAIDLAIREVRPPIFFTYIGLFKQQVSLWSYSEVYKLYDDLIKLEILSKTSNMVGVLVLKNLMLEYSKNINNIK